VQAQVMATAMATAMAMAMAMATESLRSQRAVTDQGSDAFGSRPINENLLI